MAKTKEETKVALVTGGSGGIGRYTAVSLKQAGCIVYEFSRHEKSIEGISHVSVDITDEQQVIDAIEQIISVEGHIDILVNNAGYGISGAVETTKAADAHAQLEVNLFGMDNVTRAVIPHMRQNGGGRIICISSIAGILPIPFQTWYSVSKSAIAAYCLALQNEVRPFGISVCAILPGDIATGFTDARKKSIIGDDIYGGRIARSVAVMEHDEQNGMSPERAGRFVARISLKKHSKPLVAMGVSYKGAALLAKFLPRRMSNFIVGKIYAK